jgi:hypothetical protein
LKTQAEKEGRQMQAVTTSEPRIAEAQVAVARRPERETPAGCFGCRTERMVTPEVAAILWYVDVSMVLIFAGAGMIHSRQAEDGKLLVCLHSFSTSFPDDKADGAAAREGGLIGTAVN